jgi:hypothetical protein
MRCKIGAAPKDNGLGVAAIFTYFLPLVNPAATFQFPPVRPEAWGRGSCSDGVSDFGRIGFEPAL